MHDLLETVASKVAAGGQTPSAESWFARGDRSGTTRNPAPLSRAETRPSGFSCAGREILRTPFPSCLDFPMAHSGGRKFDHICLRQQRCRNSSSITSAWVTATSPKTTLIRPPSAPIFRSDLAGVGCPVNDASRIRLLLACRSGALATPA